MIRYALTHSNCEYGMCVNMCLEMRWKRTRCILSWVSANQNLQVEFALNYDIEEIVLVTQNESFPNWLHKETFQECFQIILLRTRKTKQMLEAELNESSHVSLYFYLIF